MRQVRFDKSGRRLPDTGFGCGCQLCADANAPRYERRRRPRVSPSTWNPVRRLATRLLENLRPGRPEVA